MYLALFLSTFKFQEVALIPDGFMKGVKNYHED